MNKKTTYEMTIADKLQLLPLPDMEDAIWARIKTQLDRDLPEDDGGGSNTPKAPSGGWMWRAGLLAFVAAFLTVYLLAKKSETPASPQTIQQPVNTNSTPLAPSTPPPLLRTTNSQNGPPSVPQEGTTVLVPSEANKDSVLSLPLAEQLLSDTQAGVTALAPPPLLQDSVLKPKPKSRGVKDISDADYRIVPTKKDSTR
ncbi:hypothetical protein HRH25_05070 [Flavisolibacter sp. BT320]|nr:hypothetical protein [Flavisolibacter longurius]